MLEKIFKLWKFDFASLFLKKHKRHVANAQFVKQQVLHNCSPFAPKEILMENLKLRRSFKASVCRREEGGAYVT